MPQPFKIFIVGVNGFIGNALARRIVTDTPHTVIGIDVEKDRLPKTLLADDQFEFFHGDISINREWVEFQVKRSDIVIPLAAVAIPKIYIENPLLVFELDFLENLHIVQLAAKYKKRLIFPSTSEVYGLAQDPEFDEESTNLVLGPINKQRWIYSSGKQLLDRVIHAYGLQQGFQYSIFRPFNWVGPGLDRMDEHKIGNSRVVTQFIADIVYNRPINLVDGGAQKRCFLYIDDGIDGLMRIIANDKDRANNQIFNLGNPGNELSMREVAELLVRFYEKTPRAARHPFSAGIHATSSEEYYGRGYQDMVSRVPAIHRARSLLGWEPRYGVEEAMQLTLDWFVRSVGERSPAVAA